jgi:CubicO group peptidase (beta-lactamase class C family)
LLSIGCVPIAWTRNGDGSARFDSGVQVSARGWAQVGELLRRNGVWRAAQLVDGDTVVQACIGSFAEAHAGMGVYLAAGARTREGPIDSDLWRMNPPAPVDLVMAVGEGGQRLYIIPSANLVVARMARTLDPHDWSDGLFLTLVMRDL